MPEAVQEVVHWLFDEEQLDFIVVRIYDFYNSTDLSMACALSWVLFIIIAFISAMTFKFNKWVYYGEEV